jgi:hydrogenase/urease accessory protein HupE
MAASRRSVTRIAGALDMLAANRLVPGVALAALLVPGRAEAHLVNTGFGPFYDGISHLFVTAPDLLAVAALALLAGLRGNSTARGTLLAVIIAWTLGGVAGLAMAPTVAWTAITTGSFLLLGALLAADRELPTVVVVGLGALIGIIHGFLNGAESAASGIGFVGLVGSLAALAVLATLMSAAAVSLGRGWTRIAVRVAGSWIAAIGILMLGWLFRPGV